MNPKHHKILDFLNKQEKPVSIKDFPNSITSDFPILGHKPGTLLHELEIVLKNKDWVHMNSYVDKHYWISPHGKEALKEESIRLKTLEDLKSNNHAIYHINQAGAVGPNSIASNNNFNQVNYSLPNNTNYELLASELSTLKQALLSKASSSEDYIAISEVAKAEDATKNKDANKVVSALLSAGKWVFDVAKDIGTGLVVEILKQQMVG